MNRKPDEEQRLLDTFLAGGFGGVCAVVLGYPFDTIKTKMQAMPRPPPGQPPMYSGALDCAVKTVHQSGFKGLFQGMAAPVVGVAPIMAISFFAFSTGKKIVNSHSQNEVLTELQLFGAGAFSGLMTSVVLAPGERIKCLLQVQEPTGPQKYSGPVDVVRQLYRQGGVFTVFRGTSATICRDVPGNGVYFLTYEWFQRLLNEGSTVSIFATAMSGGLSGAAYWVVAFPADILKTRIQIAPEGAYRYGMRGMYDALRKLQREEGIHTLYRGCWPIMVRSFPANAICFTAFEFALHYLNKIG